MQPSAPRCDKQSKPRLCDWSTYSGMNFAAFAAHDPLRAERLALRIADERSERELERLFETVIGTPTGTPFTSFTHAPLVPLVPLAPPSDAVQSVRDR